MNLMCCILENEINYIDYLLEYLRRWEKESGCLLKIDVVLSGAKFLTMNPSQYNIIFIDIVLDNGNNGMEIAKTLRNKNFNGDFVFITNFQEYVFEGYSVHALDYLVKPIPYNNIRYCMQQVLNKHAASNFIIYTKNSITKILYYNILYFSSEKHSTNIITLTETIHINQGIKNVLENLPEQFAQCHRTLIVNLQHAQRITRKDILISNGELLPIGRNYLNTIKQRFIDTITNGDKYDF